MLFVAVAGVYDGDGGGVGCGYIMDELRIRMAQDNRVSILGETFDCVVVAFSFLSTRDVGVKGDDVTAYFLHGALKREHGAGAGFKEGVDERAGAELVFVCQGIGLEERAEFEEMIYCFRGPLFAIYNG